MSTAQLNRLAARKRLLVAESELNRHLLAVELADLKHSVARARKLLSLGGIAGSVLLLTARVARGWVGNRGGGSKGLLEKIIRGWELLSALEPLWKKLRATTNRATEE